MHNEIPEFNQYVNSPIFQRLTDIREFTLRADIPTITRFSNDEFANFIANRMYEQLRDVIKAARFYYENELTINRGTNQVEVAYADDRFDFSVICSENSISIRRRGSRLSNFHDWYSAFMPSAQGILTNVLSLLTEVLHRRIDIVRVAYRYNFLLYNIVPTSRGSGQKPVRNSEIMKKILRGFPDDQGLLTDSPSVLNTVGRADVTMSRWIGEEGNRRRIIYEVEAPANMGWSALWFDFHYIGESYKAPDNRREPFDPDSVLAEYDRAYVGFLRDSAINGFLEWMMRGYYFSTTTGSLP